MKSQLWPQDLLLKACMILEQARKPGPGASLGPSTSGRGNKKHGAKSKARGNSVSGTGAGAGPPSSMSIGVECAKFKRNTVKARRPAT